MRKTVLAGIVATAAALAPAAHPHTAANTARATPHPAMKANFRVADTVQVLSGDDKGAVGKVISIDTKKSRVVVEGVNMQTKHTKPLKQGDTGRIVKREGSISISKVKAVDADDAAPPAAAEAAAAE